MFRPFLNSTIIIVLGALWAAESFLGKLTIIEGYPVFEFPLFLNIGTVAVVLALCIFPDIRKNILSFEKSNLSLLAFVTLTLVFVPYAIIYTALKHISPAETALITGSTPIFSIAISIIFFKTKISLSNLSSIAIGFLGICFLIIPKLALKNLDERAWPYLMMLIVPLSYAASGYYMKQASRKKIPFLHLLLFSNTLSGIIFFLLNDGLQFNIGNSRDTLIFATGIAFNISAIYIVFYFSKIISPIALSFSNYTTILFSLLMSILFLDERFSTNVAISVVFVVFATLLKNSKSTP